MGGDPKSFLCWWLAETEPLEFLEKTVGGWCRGLAVFAKMCVEKIAKANHDKMRTICFPFSYQCYWPKSAAEMGKNKLSLELEWDLHRIPSIFCVVFWWWNTNPFWWHQPFASFCVTLMLCFLMSSTFPTKLWAFFGPGLQRNGEALRHRGQTSAIHLHKVEISEPLDEKILAIKDIW